MKIAYRLSNKVMLVCNIKKRTARGTFNTLVEWGVYYFQL